MTTSSKEITNLNRPQNFTTLLRKMATGTMISRILGLVRIFALGYALGISGTSDAYNLANTTPNIIHDLVLGGVLAATFVPVFTKRLTSLPLDEAWEGISAVVTLSAVVLIVATFIFELAAPIIVSAYTIGSSSNLSGQSHTLAVDFLRLFVPQLLLYGFISIASALLNSSNKFTPVTLAPIFNNVMVIFILIEFGILEHHPSPSLLLSNSRYIWLIGLGTSAGVAAQFLALIPSLRKSNLHLKWNWNPKHEAVSEIRRLSGWTFGFVAINQIALFVILSLAARSAKGTVTAYTYAYTFFQLPYWMFAVSVSVTLAPELSKLWTLDDKESFKKRLSRGISSINALIFPAAVGYLVLSTSIVSLILNHGAASTAGIVLTAQALRFLALGLPGFCIFMLTTRAFFSMQNAKTVFWIYVVENSLNVVLAIVLVVPLGIRGIALSISIAYTLSAFLSIVLMRNRLGGLGLKRLFRLTLRVLILTLITGLVAATASSVFSTSTTIGNLADVILGVVAGIVTYGGLAGILAKPNGSAVKMDTKV